MASYGLLEAKEEEELYRTRLLNVEEKPFKRITKRLANLNKMVSASVRQTETPPPEGEDNEEEAETDNKKKADVEEREQEREQERERRRAELAQLREDATLDFAALDASVARLQFLAAANERERTRYAADRHSIVQTCDAVRDNMVVLRTQLEEARTTLTRRRALDAQADRILHSKTLRPRPDQQASIRKLEEECRQLQSESAAYAETWRERKEQFARIVDESMRLRRLIRDEKEEVERREGMDEDEQGQASKHGGGSGSGGNTAGGGNTPVPSHGESLKPAAPSRAVSREATPAAGTPAAPAPAAAAGEDDVDMVEADGDEQDAKPAATDPTQAATSTSEGDKMDTT